MRKTRAIYLDAIRDWVRNGEKSEYVFTPRRGAIAHLPEFTDDVALGPRELPPRPASLGAGRSGGEAHALLCEGRPS